MVDEGRPVGRPTVQQKARSVRAHSYELRPPRTEAEWDRYHAIRKTCLFDTYHPWIPYDRHHPDECRRDHHPLGFLLDGELVGTIRVDLKDGGRTVFRMLAIADGLRGQHLGSRLLQAAEDYAGALGATSACLNAVQPALDFYLRHGYAPFRWQGCTSCATSVPLVKWLHATADRDAAPPGVADAPVFRPPRGVPSWYRGYS